MSIFKNIFGDSEDKKSTNSNVDWIELNSINELDTMMEESSQDLSLIFKHSTRCSISRMALKQFEREFTAKDKIKTYFLDLLEHRDVSNEIASRLLVQHQSPQLLLIKDGKCVYNASHQDIDASRISTEI